MRSALLAGAAVPAAVAGATGIGAALRGRPRGGGGHGVLLAGSGHCRGRRRSRRTSGAAVAAGVLVRHLRSAAAGLWRGDRRINRQRAHRPGVRRQARTAGGRQPGVVRTGQRSAARHSALPPQAPAAYLDMPPRACPDTLSWQRRRCPALRRDAAGPPRHPAPAAPPPAAYRDLPAQARRPPATCRPRATNHAIARKVLYERSSRCYNRTYIYYDQLIGGGGGECDG